MKTFVEIHALQNFAPSNLNRDDTGAPKDALFGGSRRARISSQCIKRAIRQHFKEFALREGMTADDIASRTKRLLDALIKELQKKGHTKDEAEAKTRLALEMIGFVMKEDGKTEYLLFLGQREISAVAEIIHDKWDAIVTSKAVQAEGKKTSKTKKQTPQGADSELKNALKEVFDGGKAVDVALFGRMLADMPEKNQDAACQVAHAISTHAVEREFDFYTAVDDLKPDDTAGADMMGTVEFNSACFYRYAVVDWEKLVKNLQDDAELAAKGLHAFLKGFTVAMPTGKQNTFAAHNPPELVVISVRRDTAPRNLANAFETAVRVKRDESITLVSAERLNAKEAALNKLYGTSPNSHYAVVEDLFGEKYSARGLGEKEESITALIQWAVSEISEKKEA